MNEQQASEAAALLIGARHTHRPLDGLPEACRPRTVDEGYRVQDELIARLGAPVAGWKIGCTNRKLQEMLGTDEPFAGRLLAPWVQQSPARIEAAGMFMRALEVEFAFRLARDLPAADGPFGETQVAAAVASLHPALEIPDSRYRDWLAAGLAATVADNGVQGAFVFGAGREGWRDIDRKGISVALIVNGETVARGVGANALGDPLKALVWLANDRARRGDGLEAGQLVTTGNCCETLGWAEAGDVVVADFGDFGRVQASFV